MNDVKIDGKITKRGVSIRYAPSGMAVADFSISRSRKNKRTDQWEVEFFDVRAFDKVAEGIAGAGGKVLVEGYLKQQRWKKDDQERRRIIIVATSVMGDEKPPDKPADDDVPF